MAVLADGRVLLVENRFAANSEDSREALPADENIFGPGTMLEEDIKDMMASTYPNSFVRLDNSIFSTANNPETG